MTVLLPHRCRKAPERIRADIDGWLFALPYMILFFVFTVLPVIMAILLSFTRFNMLQPPTFVGLDNYLKLFLEDDIFPLTMKNTLILAAVTGPVGYILCFFFAWCLNEMRPRVRAVFTFLLYSPSIAGNAYLIWTLIFSGDSYGYLNAILLRAGIIYQPIRWFQDPTYMLPLVIAVSLWMSLGTNFLVFIAGFQGLDVSLYEAGAVDGMKNRWQELWYITLPGMRAQLLFSAVMSITGAFSIGDIVSGLCGEPSTGYAAHTLMLHLRDYGTTRFEMGYASAIAVLLFAMMLLSNLLFNRILRRVGT